MFLLAFISTARKLRLAKVPLLPSVLGRLARIIYGCEISYLAKIHPSTRFPHKGLGVVIGDGVQVGPGCTILHNVTIGGRGGASVPVLEGNVLVGAGACVLGDVHVGWGASIGANAVVVRDVPSGVTVVGVPAERLSDR